MMMLEENRKGRKRVRGRRKRQGKGERKKREREGEKGESYEQTFKGGRGKVPTQL